MKKKQRLGSVQQGIKYVFFTLSIGAASILAFTLAFFNYHYWTGSSDVFWTFEGMTRREIEFFWLFFSMALGAFVFGAFFALLFQVFNVDKE